MSVVELGWDNQKLQLSSPHQLAHNYNSIINQSVNKLNKMIGTMNSSISNQKKIMMKRLDSKNDFLQLPV